MYRQNFVGNFTAKGFKIKEAEQEDLCYDISVKYLYVHIPLAYTSIKNNEK